ncbi:hypothetical protein BC748_2884 [Flavobacterium dankookense]|uniref:Uncharacterized protein n=1 Tax=Flavobacterium dankookense TaxID=706186 RepID=A0A4R6Q4S7_9FLAO|nr:hypothetical protein BC748_2884 [Flavobacterium dankookense]
MKFYHQKFLEQQKNDKLISKETKWSYFKNNVVAYSILQALIWIIIFTVIFLITTSSILIN